MKNEVILVIIVLIELGVWLEWDIGRAIGKAASKRTGIVLGIIFMLIFPLFLTGIAISVYSSKNEVNPLGNYREIIRSITKHWKDAIQDKRLGLYMKNIKKSKIAKKFIHRIILLALFFFMYATFNQVYYENVQFPSWTDAHGMWSLDDERNLMRGYDFAKRDIVDKKRKDAIISGYYIDDTLCYAWITARNGDSLYSKNPYGINLTIYSLPGAYASCTVKHIKVRSASGKEYASDFANEKLPATVEFKNNTSESLDWVTYGTEEVFKLRRKPITVEFDLEINGIDVTKRRTVIFELKPVVINSIPNIVAVLLGAGI
jgi:hypothetical protein